MEDTINYFGYGANRDRDMMAAITGNPNLEGFPATLNGFQLAVQKFDQTPQNVQELLQKVWDSDFETYTIKPGPGRVAGMVWKLTKEERELVKDWELTELGWYEKMVLEVSPENGSPISVVTEGLRHPQRVDHIVDGEHYETFLNSKKRMLEVAEQSRAEYFVRLKSTEGALKPSRESELP